VAQRAVFAAAAHITAIHAIDRVDASNNTRILRREDQRSGSSAEQAEDTEPAFNGAAIAGLSESEQSQFLEVASQPEESIRRSSEVERTAAKAEPNVRIEWQCVEDGHARAREAGLA
jgi:hypothetical protein